MYLLENAWAGGSGNTNAFQMQKLGGFTVKMTADTWSTHTLTMESSPNGTLWATYQPDGTAETWVSGDQNDTRSFTDGPCWFRFTGDGVGSGVDIHIWVGGNGLTLVGTEPTFS